VGAARLVRDGRTVARGTVRNGTATVRTTRRLPRGAYRLVVAGGAARTVVVS
jgi:hypothetical protein